MEDSDSLYNESTVKLYENLIKNMLGLDKSMTLTAENMRLLGEDNMKEGEALDFVHSLIVTNTEIMESLLGMIELRAKQLFLQAYAQKERAIIIDICEMRVDSVTEVIKKRWMDRGFDVSIIDFKLTLRW